MRKTMMTAAAAATLMTGSVCLAQTEKTLSPGDKAPSVDIAHWVKGVEVPQYGEFKPMKNFEEGKVYVLEFWATWCGPCVASMPHLSELQEEYKDYDVTIIGVSDEPLPTVYNFLWKEYKKDGKIQNERTNYTLTTDPDRSVYNDYMKAAGQNGIPTSFIIGKEGHVEWIGHPMGLDEPLGQVVRDNWDRDAFRAEYEKNMKGEREMAKAQQKLMTAVQSEDWDTAMDIYDTMIEENDGAVGMKFQKFMMMLTSMNRPNDAYAYGEEVLEGAWDNDMMLNQVAWIVATDEGVKTRDLDFAMKAAKRANKLTNSENAAILDTLARVHFEKGNLEEAVEWQTKAVKHDTGDFGDDLTNALAKYKKALSEN